MLLRSTAEVHDWLTACAGELFPGRGSLLRVTHQGRGTIVRAQLDFERGAEKVILKRFPPASLDTRAFIELHNRLVQRNPTLQSFTPTFLACHAEGQWIAMLPIEGQTLEDRLIQSLDQGDEVRAECDRLLRIAGSRLAEFHRVAGEDVGLPPAARENASFLQGFEEYLIRSRWLLALAGIRERHLNHFRQLFEGGRLAGLSDRVVPIDAQPKNILVSLAGDVHFIDLAYLEGSPAMGAGLFLASIDRLGLRRPWMRPNVLARWRGAFLEGYLSNIDADIGRHLCLFYPWSLLLMMEQHRLTRPAVGRIAALWYARQLAIYLKNTPPNGSFQWPHNRPQAAEDQSPLWRQVCAYQRTDF